MITDFFSRIRRVRFRLRNAHEEDGFATVQFASLMALTVMLLATFVNILLVEHMRTSQLASLRDAARAGTRVVDLRRAVESGDPTQVALAVDECETRLENSTQDLNPALDGYTMTCSVEYDADGDLYFMKASVTGDSGVQLVPWASVFSGRLKNLSATHVATEAAR